MKSRTAFVVPLALVLLGLFLVQGMRIDFAAPATGDSIYVMGYSRGSVTVIDDRTNTVSATVLLPAGASTIGFAYDTRTGLIDIPCSGTVLEPAGIIQLDPSSNAVSDAITLSFPGYGAAFDPSNGFLYVAEFAGFASTVAVISDLTGTVVSSVAVGADPFGIVYDQDYGYLYVSDALNRTVSVISDKSDTVVSNIAVGYDPEGVALDPNQGYVYVANLLSGTVSVISDRTNSVVDTIDVGGNPYLETFDTAKGYLYVTDLGFKQVYVISARTNALLTVIPVAGVPVDAVYDPSNGNIYVTELGANEVGVISDSTNTIVSSITQIFQPYGIGIAPTSQAPVQTTIPLVLSVASVGAMPIYGRRGNSVQS